MNIASRILTLAIASLLLAGCAPTPATETPIPSISFAGAKASNKSVVIMLPGRGDRAETFVREGFEAAGQAHGFDTVLVDAHFGYYRKRNLIPRLHEDIIEPARKAGYDQIWLLGISLGGFGSVLYAAEHPEGIDGVILLAPFLGEQDVIDEIASAGGLDNWNPASSSLKDHEIAMWSWLQTVILKKSATRLILGYGKSDRLADSYQALLDELDPARVYVAEGGHNWDTWRKLWAEVSAELDF